MESVMESVIKS